MANITGDRLRTLLKSTAGRPMRRIAVGAFALVAVAGCSSGETAYGPAPTEASPAGAIQLLAPQAWADYVAANPSVPVVNVHVPYEGHIADSNMFAAFDTILDWAELPADKDAPLVLYCRSGNMSGQASEELVAAGYTNIIDLEGGMNAWAAEGLPLLTERPAGAG